MKNMLNTIPLSFSWFWTKPYQQFYWKSYVQSTTLDKYITIPMTLKYDIFKSSIYSSSSLGWD